MAGVERMKRHGYFRTYMGDVPYVIVHTPDAAEVRDHGEPAIELCCVAKAARACNCYSSIIRPKDSNYCGHIIVNPFIFPRQYSPTIPY